MKTAVPLDELKLELADARQRMNLAAERWVEARAAGLDTRVYDDEQKRAARDVRRLERRINRRRS